MATTTPNYGWTVPTSTDLVKDGATAIETLGDAIDASMNTALGTKKAGMVLLNTTSFSAVSSQAINSVFSSTYQNYRVLMTLTTSSTQNFNWRFRVGTTDTTSAIYQWSGWYNNSAAPTVVGENGTNATAFPLYCETIETNYAFDIFRPNTATPTTYVGHTIRGSGTAGHLHRGGSINDTLQYDGFNLIVVTGGSTLTGAVRVYGYNQ
jgi:hypothetical protein